MRLFQFFNDSLSLISGTIVHDDDLPLKGSIEIQDAIDGSLHSTRSIIGRNHN